jgi:hypothetical protein
VANGLLQWLVDSDLGIDWTHNALRNWDEVGWTALKGQLVTNPGGHDALEHPVYYTGHRAASLYLPLLVGRLFAWTGLYALPFHAVSTLLVLFGFWHLLGRTEKAFSIGAVAILCPGYVLWPTTLDPNTIAVLTGIPYAALLCWQLRQPRLALPAVILLLVATVAFTLLNWTTALVHVQIFISLLLARMVSWRRLVLYAVLGIVSATAVVCTSVASKMSQEAFHHPRFTQLLAGYTWGNTGYNMFGLSTITLLVRMAFINLLGLLPLWLFWGWILLQNVKAEPTRVAAAMTPVGLAALQAMAMRNYFGHHPWMAAPLFLLGLALSLFMVLRPPLTSVAQPIAAVMGRRYLSWAAAFAFGLVVLLFYREHQSRLLSLVSMVRSHSARTDDIVVVRDLDTNTVELAPRLSEVLDRWLVIVDDLPDAAHPVPASFLLSTAPVPGNWPLAARGTNDPLQSLPLLHEPLDWFSKNIARRAPGDRINAAETYYLYRVPSNLMAPAYHAEHERSLFPEKP